MKRRSFIARSALVIAAVSGGALAWRRAHLAQPSLASLVGELDALRGRRLRSAGAWSPYRVFMHLAQSIHCSIDGYPDLRPAWFRHSLGSAAFFAFETAGAMRHGRDQPIPGAPAIAAEGEAGAAIEALLQSLRRFDQHSGVLQSHFAYGALDRPQYLAAHTMHVRDHLGEILVDPA
jgi:hypothetical protein